MFDIKENVIRCLFLHSKKENPCFDCNALTANKYIGLGYLYQQIERWPRYGSKWYWKQKQIELFSIHSSLIDLHKWSVLPFRVYWLRSIQTTSSSHSIDQVSDKLNNTDICIRKLNKYRIVSAKCVLSASLFNDT